MARQFQGFGSSSSYPANLIAIVRIQGAIGNETYRTLSGLVEQAFEMPDVLCVLLLINSPGGSPTQTSMLAQDIRSRADAKHIPVYALVEDVAASGGYWLACAADQIYVDENSMLGSIGVIYSGLGAADALRHVGIEPRIIGSSRNKVGLHPLAEYDEQQEALLRSNMQIVHRNFVDYVRVRRPNLPPFSVDADADANSDTDIYSGRVFVGQEAVDRGLADGVAMMSELLQIKYPNRTDLKAVEVKRKSDIGLLGKLLDLLPTSSWTMRTTVQSLLEIFVRWTESDCSSPQLLQAKSSHEIAY